MHTTNKPLKGQLDMYGNVVEGDDKAPSLSLHKTLVDTPKGKLVQVYSDGEFVAWGEAETLLEVFSNGYIEDRTVYKVDRKEIVVTVYARKNK